MLVNSIFKSRMDHGKLAMSLKQDENATSDGKGNLSLQFIELKSQTDNLKNNKSVKLSDKIIDELSYLIYDYLYNETLREKLSYSFGSSLDELAQIKRMDLR